MLALTKRVLVLPWLLFFGFMLPIRGFAFGGVQMLTPKYFQGQFTFSRTWARDYPNDLPKLRKSLRKAAGSLDETKQDSPAVSPHSIDDPAVIARLHFAARKHIKHQRFEQARHIYETVVELSGGQHGRSFLLWALLEQRCGDFERARSVFRQALEHHPHSDQVAMAWGLLESKQGLPRRAKLLLERAAVLNPSRNFPVKKWKRLQPIFQKEQDSVSTPRWAQKSWATHLCSGWDETCKERRQWVENEVERLLKQQEVEEMRRNQGHVTAAEAGRVRQIYGGE